LIWAQDRNSGLVYWLASFGYTITVRNQRWSISNLL